MPVIWNLKKWLALERDIYRPSELQALITEKTGVHLSLQAISALMNATPSGMRFQTMQVLCDALDCDVCDFFTIHSSTSAEKKKLYKAAGDAPVRLYGPKEKLKNEGSIFPNPHEYADEGKTQRNRQIKGKEKR